MAGLIGLIRRGDLKRAEHVLFVHTGGLPTLYAYQSMLQSWSAPGCALI
jgi:D-cysteine desulfhydrase